MSRESRRPPLPARACAGSRGPDSCPSWPPVSIADGRWDALLAGVWLLKGRALRLRAGDATGEGLNTVRGRVVGPPMWSILWGDPKLR